MEQLAPGTALDATGMHVPGARTGATLDVVERIGEMPYGDIYRARIDGIPVLATLVDPMLVGDARTLAWIIESLSRAASIDHRNLTPCYGIAGGAPGKRKREDPCVVVQGHSDARQARQWIADRAMRGRTVELETARTVIGHLCNALSVLHGVMVHGYVGVDTVWLSTTGRVLLSDAGLGPLVSRSRRFARMQAAGRLPGLAPEQIGGTVALGPGTDVFGLATLFLELVTGRPLPEAGAPMSTVGLAGPDDLVLCLERATAPDLHARPPDAATFKAELSEALPPGVHLELRAPSAPARVGPPRAPTPAVLDFVRPPAPLVLPPLAPARTARPSAPAEPPPPAPAAASDPMSERPRTPVFVPAPIMMPPVGPAAPGATTAMPGHPAGMMPGAPGASMPVMMPNGVPAMGVVGAPVAGPGGYPAYVPVYVSMPAPQPEPAAAPASNRPKPTAMDLDALDQLDRATRRIADAGAAEAVLELTEDVSQRTMRTVEVPAAASSASMSASASASGVRVDLGFGEPARGRTPTEPVPTTGHGRTPTDPAPAVTRSRSDRTPPPVATRPPSRDRTPPPVGTRSHPDRTPAPVGTRSHPDRTPAPVGTRTPPDRMAAPAGTRSHPDRTPPPVDRRGGLAFDDEDVGDDAQSPAMRWVLRRAGATPTEHSLVELATMARAGRLAPDDVLVQASTGRQMLVADVAALRDALHERGPAVPIGSRPPPPVVVPPMLITHAGGSKPLVWILVALVVLAGLGVLAWSRLA